MFDNRPNRIGRLDSKKIGSKDRTLWHPIFYYTFLWKNQLVLFRVDTNDYVSIETQRLKQYSFNKDKDQKQIKKITRL